MSATNDAERIQHGVACLTKLRELAQAGAANGDAEVMVGLFRKMEQIAGYGLANIGVEVEAVAPAKTFEEKANAIAKARIRELTDAK